MSWTTWCPSLPLCTLSLHPALILFMPPKVNHLQYCVVSPPDLRLAIYSSSFRCTQLKITYTVFSVVLWSRSLTLPCPALFLPSERLFSKTPYFFLPSCLRYSPKIHTICSLFKKCVCVCVQLCTVPMHVPMCALLETGNWNKVSYSIILHFFFLSQSLSLNPGSH